MAYINENYLKLKAGYLFPEIGRRLPRPGVPGARRGRLRAGAADGGRPGGADADRGAGSLAVFAGVTARGFAWRTERSLGSRGTLKT